MLAFLSNNEFPTTEIELDAIAIDAKIGFNSI